MTENEYIEKKRKIAKKYLPKVKEMVNKYQSKDPKLVSFIQEVFDCYMANVCKLGRKE